MRHHGIMAMVCWAAGAALLGLGALVPAHLRALDRDLVVAAGLRTPGAADAARQALAENRVGTATRLFEAAPATGNPGPATPPAALRWGGPAPWLDRHLGNLPAPTPIPGQADPVLGWALPEAARGALLRGLQSSTHPCVMALLACRKLERTELFPAVPSPAGQPLDATLLVGAALAESGRLQAGLALDWERAANAAVQGRGTLPLERAMMDLLSAARWLDWDQLATLAERCEDAASLATLTAHAGAGGRDWNPVFAAVFLTPGARPAATFLARHGGDGLADLREALGLGSGAVRELLRYGHRIHHPATRARAVRALHLEPLAAWLTTATAPNPGVALGAKYVVWLDGLFLLLLGAWHFRRRFLDEAVRRFDPRPDWRVLGVASLTACVLLFLAAEQFIVLQRPPPNTARAEPMPSLLRARFRADLPKAKTPAMNEKMIAMLAAFFVIQLALYLSGLARLRHLRERPVDATVKLRLIDNEETLFDAPLYMGIAGSVLALVLRLTGYEGVSLMASYSSTLFGILFCFILKVLHVRPCRQRLILESTGNPSA